MADGHIVYQGRAKDSPLYFNSIGLQIPTYSNPADFYMRSLKITYPKKQEDHEKIKMLTESYDRTMKDRIEQESNAVSLSN